MSVKERFIDDVLSREGGYVDDPLDSGGETNYGITERVARENGYTGRMIDMPLSFARSVYSQQYWDAVAGDDLAQLDAELALEVADTAVNMGQVVAAKFLQRALNVLNVRQQLYNDLVIDGVIGLATIKAVTAYARTRRMSVLVSALNCLQGSFYISLAERREKDERFLYGWLLKRVVE